MSAMLLSALFDTKGFAIVLPTGFWYWIIIGLIAGWLAGKISRGRGFGCIADIILGIVGSFIGGWIFTKLNIPGTGFWYMLAAATLGAVLLVFVAHLFSPSDR
ncbi:MAG TPA: GlsB/YeaQ/YmgE family stress response membrane protein [Candidatus Acidoferrum sp.]|jgi:uncharacterized membrane protein YeaQ/YmgE (transglycosylase-associated protein family)|nr:GlsB/YeaQ/YmgE family stress response membrane protein [Candidatus Acidoferrum sp.]